MFGVWPSKNISPKPDEEAGTILQTVGCSLTNHTVMAALSDQVLPFVFLSFYNICIKDKYFKLCNYINIVLVWAKDWQEATRTLPVIL